MNKFVKGALIAVTVVGIVRFFPDFVRYMKICAM